MVSVPVAVLVYVSAPAATKTCVHVMFVMYFFILLLCVYNTTLFDALRKKTYTGGFLIWKDVRDRKKNNEWQTKTCELL